MINLTELRVGNFIHVADIPRDSNIGLIAASEKKIAKVVEKEIGKPIAIEIEGSKEEIANYYCLPMPLSSKFLENARFIKQSSLYVREFNSNDPYHRTIYVDIDNTPNTISLKIDNYKGTAMVSQILSENVSVHTLQNIWFYLFKEEIV